jgi:ribonuclease P protein subunit POP4
MHQQLKRELIGLRASVVMSSHPDLIGISGEIVDETKNMLVIRSASGDKKIPKAACVFEITLPDGNQVKIDGIKIVGSVEDRIRR